MPRRACLAPAPEPDAAARRRALAADGALSVVEAARFIGASRTFVYGEMTTGRLPFARVGRKRVIPRAALVAYLSERLVELCG
jgi:excisionase family DNA binding protein